MLLLDIFMDDVNWVTGIKLIKEIRAKSILPIIIVSDQKSETIKIMALDAGADDFVSTETNPLVKSALHTQQRLYLCR